MIDTTYCLFGFTIVAVWLRPITFGKHSFTPWPMICLGTLISGYHHSYFNLTALLELVVFGGVAYLMHHAESRSYQSQHSLSSSTQAPVYQKTWAVIALFSLTTVLALALALHHLPGFHNPKLFSNIQFSAEAAPFTLYANFDKGIAGLVLLAVFCKRCYTSTDWKTVIRHTFPVALITIISVFSIAMLNGYVKTDLKWSNYTPVFLATNLLFTCIAEEAFFRGFLQQRLAHLLVHLPSGQMITIVSSALLFGIAHAAGGLLYVILATLAGLGYSYAYAATERIEAPILVHFIFNAIHFIGFTYPAIR